MAKNPTPFYCDECNTPKTPSNNWLLMNPLSPTGINIFKWDDEKAEIQGVKHLCGIQCVLKAAGKELAKIYGSE